MTTLADIAKTRKRVREIMYSWIGIAEITELKHILGDIDRMLLEYMETKKKEPREDLEAPKYDRIREEGW